jgi:hypothetical protein
MAEVHRQPGACRWGVGLTTKEKIIAYWTTTALVASAIGSGGVAQLALLRGNVRGTVPVLGLAIARWIAEAHHGRLVLVHSDASGSTFAAFLSANGAVAAESTDTRHPKRESAS